MSGVGYVVRAARPEDLPAFRTLRALAGPGFTSLSISDEALESRLGVSGESFAHAVTAPGEERYILALEAPGGGEVAGLAQVKATIGVSQPFFNFRVLRIAQVSAAARRRHDLDVLMLVNESAQCSEVGSLFVRSEHRAAGVGRLLAQARYMMMAAAPQRFGERIVSELRGRVDANGVSPFWEHLGRHFFRMDFEEADRLSATTDNQFILDLMPKYPIYVDLLAPEAQAVIGLCHPEGEPARRLLEKEGFRYDNLIDIFDAGPLLSAARDTIATRRLAVRWTARTGEPGEKQALLANPDMARFRCTRAAAALGDDGAAVLAPATMQALSLRDGEAVLVRVDDAP
ncbi:MAG: arginine N-succinyltransferase [Hyphomonadaceae bacterium]